jgi:hypothetical protein
MSTYRKISDDELEKFLRDFMANTSKLPDLGLTEITLHVDTSHIWGDFVNTPRKWSDMARTLRARGWTKNNKRRCVSYVAGGKYETKQTQRWSPPTKTEDV